MPGYNIEEIKKQLREIEALESEIQNRVCNSSSIVKTPDGMKLDQINIDITIKCMALNLKTNHPELNPVLIALMDGGMPFASKLNEELNSINYEHSWTTMSVSSYGNETTSSGQVKIAAQPKLLVGARNVIIVDDICETGNTYVKTKEKILELGASSVSLMVLVEKPEKRQSHDAKPLYAGFRVAPDAFLIGMGLDYRGGGKSRGLPSINAVDPSSLPTEEEMQILDKKKELNQTLVAALAERQLEKTAQQALCSSKATFSFGGLPKESVVNNLSADVASSSLS